jgi:hypothetical protein
MASEKATIYEYIQEQDPHHEGTKTFIQWKGTDVCMDFHCKCGLHMHFDCEFLYFVRCSGCGTDYMMSSQVMAIETPPHLAEEVAAMGCLWTDAGEDDSQAERVND